MMQLELMIFCDQKFLDKFLKIFIYDLFSNSFSSLKNELKEAKIIADADRLKRRIDEIEKILKEGRKSIWKRLENFVRSKF